MRAALPSGSMSQTEDTSDLPESIREIVAEIESEIGEDDAGHLLESAIAPRPATNGAIEEAVRHILVEIGEDPAREGLVGTPDRVHRMYAGAHGRLSRRPRAADQPGRVRRRLLRDGRRQGHPVLLAVRAPPAAVLRHRRTSPTSPTAG